MSSSFAKAIIVGNLGRDPEERSFANGGKVVTFSVATTQNWKDQRGERQERTSWQNISVYNDAVAEISMRYLKKGSRVAIEAAIESRSYEKDGQKVFVTEFTIRPFSGELHLLDNKPADEPSDRPAQRQQRGAQPKPGPR